MSTSWAHIRRCWRIIRRHRLASDFAYCDRSYHSVVCLFVCHVPRRSCIVLKRQKISIRFLLHTTARCLPGRVKIWLTLIAPNFAPKWPIHCWFERRRHSIANCGFAAEWSEIAEWSKWRAYETTVALSNVSVTPSSSLTRLYFRRRAFTQTEMDFISSLVYQLKLFQINKLSKKLDKRNIYS